MKVICDSCKREFEMSQNKLKEKYLGAMYTEVYYECPKCNKKHLVCVMNSKCRALKGKMEVEIKNKFSITNSIDVILQDEKIDNIQEEFKREMNKINAR